MGTILQQTFMFLVQFVFGLYSFAVILRLWLRLASLDAYQPFIAAIAKSTAPIIHPLKKYLPDIGHLESASMVLLLVVTLVKLLLVSFISGHVPQPIGLLAWTLISTVEVCLDTIFYVMIITAILSWIPHAQPALSSLFAQMTAPLLAPIRRFIPLLGGMDLSPIVVLVAIQIIEMLMVHPIVRASLMAAFS